MRINWFTHCFRTKWTLYLPIVTVWTSVSIAHSGYSSSVKAGAFFSSCTVFVSLLFLFLLRGPCHLEFNLRVYFLRLQIGDIGTSFSGSVHLSVTQHFAPASIVWLAWGKRATNWAQFTKTLFSKVHRIIVSSSSQGWVSPTKQTSVQLTCANLNWIFWG